MPKFSEISLSKIKTCHDDLKIILHEAIKIVDFTVLEGSRTLEQQQKYFKEGKSKLDGIKQKSKHQISKESPLSLAVDIAPYPVDWSNNSKKLARFYFLAGVIISIATKLRIEGKINHSIRWGGDWDRDLDFSDNRFDDLPHFELIN
jgi:peptidoglycan LD-endopeptidase CwlK